MSWFFPQIGRSKGTGRRVLLVGIVAAITALGSFGLTPSSTTLSVSSGAVTAGQVVTLTAIVKAGATSISPGVVTFYDGPSLLGQRQLIGGSASLKVRLGIGSHSVQALFSRTTAYSASSSPVQSVTVSGGSNFPSATTITSSGSIGNYTLTATVADFGNISSSGPVSFIDSTDGNKVVAEQNLDPATLTVSTLQQAPVTYVGVAGYTAVSGDFNGDGIADVIETRTSATLDVFLGKGDGTFNPSLVVTLPADAYQMAVGDWNGDGKLDVAIGYGTTPSAGVAILLGNGDGTFTSGTGVSYGYTGSLVSTVVAGDFTGDGIQDLLVTSSSGTAISLYAGKGDGTFTFLNTFTSASVGTLVAADMNGDGLLDVVATAGNSGVSIFLNKGAGTFAAPVSYSTTAAVHGTDYLIFETVADMNSDGRPDVLACNNSTHCYVALGNGDGTLASWRSYDMPSTLGGIFTGDINGDGTLDMLVPLHPVSTPGSLGIFYGNGDGTFQSIRQSGSFSAPQLVVPGDFNGDSIPDFAIFSVNTKVNPSQTSLFSLLGAQSETATVSNVAIHYGGANSVYGAYAGDGYRAASQSSPITLQGINDTTTSVSSSAPSVAYSGSLTLTATISANGQVPTGTVTFSGNGVTLGTVAVSAGTNDGVASLATSALPAGSDSVVATYSGDAQNNSSTSSPLTVTVTPVAAAVVLNSSLNPAAYTQAVTFTATPESGATGTVTFLDGSSPLGTVALAGGSATFTTSNLSGGTHAMTAHYNGDANHSAGTSNTVSQVVQKAAVTIAIASSENPSKYHDSVLLSFAVTGTGASPSGTLAIADGGTNLGTLTLDGSGHASLSSSAFQAGSHGLVCTYNGDSNYF